MRATLLFITLISFVSSPVFGQDYQPLLDNPTWNINIANFGGQYGLVINPGIDETINSVTYKKFHDPFYDTDVLLRENVTTRKVYRLVGGAEELLYDFSLVTGDNITLANGHTYNATVSNVNVEGGSRKRIHLYHPLYTGGTWIEGVGSNMHPLVPEYLLPTDPYVYLTCSTQNGVPVYNHGIANGGTPSDCSMLLATNAVAVVTASMHPNPFSSSLTITTASTLHNADLILYNLYGQTVNTKQDLNGNTVVLERGNLAPGVYLLQLKQGSKIVATKKVIVTD